MKALVTKLSIIAVFVLGAICGASAIYIYRLRVERQIIDSPEPVINLTIIGMDRDLDLSDEQKDRVREILRGARTQMLTSNPELIPNLRQLFESTQGRIGDVLTPEQQVTYQRLVEERRRMLQEVESSSPEPNRGP